MTLHFQDSTVTLHCGRALDIARELPDESVNCIVTSPPYFNLRDYDGIEGQYGLEATPAEYVENLRALFAELHRVLAADGTLWLNLGDTYSSRADASAGHSSGRARPRVMPRRVNTSAGLGPKQKLGIPWRVAFALQDDGWILRNEIIWSKPNAKPESVTDRLTSRHEHVFLFSKCLSYWFDLTPLREPTTFGDPDGGSDRATGSGSTRSRGRASRRTEGTNMGATGSRHTASHSVGRNPGDVWTIPIQPFPGEHFAAMPPNLAIAAVLAGCKPDGVVLDPCSGSGTTGLAAQRTGRRYVGIDLHPGYLDLSLRTRLRDAALNFSDQPAQDAAASDRRPA
jgi:site-specific DNA-methyltransferase (cytosine-N4-specific)